jgi:hypothetical protein
MPIVFKKSFEGDDEPVEKYSDSQPRRPKGPAGGQFAPKSGGGGAAGEPNPKKGGGEGGLGPPDAKFPGGNPYTGTAWAKQKAESLARAKEATPHVVWGLKARDLAYAKKPLSALYKLMKEAPLDKVPGLKASMLKSYQGGKRGQAHHDAYVKRHGHPPPRTH